MFPVRAARTGNGWAERFALCAPGHLSALTRLENQGLELRTHLPTGASAVWQAAPRSAQPFDGI